MIYAILYISVFSLTKNHTTIHRVFFNLSIEELLTIEVVYTSAFTFRQILIWIYFLFYFIYTSGFIL